MTKGNEATGMHISSDYSCLICACNFRYVLATNDMCICSTYGVTIVAPKVVFRHRPNLTFESLV